MTSDIVDLKTLISAIKNKSLVLEATLRSYTPWAGGCAGNATLTIKNGRVVDVCLPDAKSLIGRARWLGRVAVATVLGTNIDMKEAERPVAAVLGSTSMASRVRVEVEPLWDRRSLVKTLDQAVRRASHSSIKSSAGPHGWKKPNPLQDLLFSIEQAIGAKGFAKLARNPRLKLAVMGRRTLLEVAEKAPLPPGLASFKLRVYSHAGSLNEKAKTAATLLTAAPLLVGLGAMTTRGYGRFCIEEYSAPRGIDSILDELRCANLAKLTSNQAARLVIEAHEKLGRLLLSHEKASSPSSGHTPLLDKSLTRAETLNGDIYDALNRIGRATTKQCWKKIAGIKNTAPGANLHTWPLGLPRQQKTGGYTVYESSKDQLCLNTIPGEAGRRLSMVHLYSLPPGHNGVNVIVATYKARDLDKLLAGPRKLYHVGKYVKYWKGKKPIFEDSFHLVSVNSIAKSHTPRINDPCHTRHWEHGGIQGPYTKQLAPGDVLHSALEAAVDFLIEALRRGC